MARQLRVEYAGALYHVTSRGNAGEDIYRSEVDRARFLVFLGDTVEQYRWICHGYCLMGNHYHLLLETPEPTLSKGMKLLNSRYCIWFNRKHQRAGHLLQGRYKAVLVQKHSHLLELVRYLVLNPVRVGLVKKAGEWEWSSYRATAGFAEVPPFLKVGWILSCFSQERARAVVSYRAFVQEGEGKQAPWEGVVGQMFLGNEGFPREARQASRSASANGSPEIPARQRSAGRPLLSQLFSGMVLQNRQMRNLIIIRAFREYLYSQKEIGDYLGLSHSRISMIVKEEGLRGRDSFQ